MLFLKRRLCLALAATFCWGYALTWPSQALHAQSGGVPGSLIPYSGKLTNAANQAVADGVYNFTFSLYDVETGGRPLWSEIQEGIAVQGGGSFYVQLGGNQALPNLDSGQQRWLETAVRGPNEQDYTVLTPRQQLTPKLPLAPAGAAAAPSCPHNHWGESWFNAGTGLFMSSAGNTGLGASALHAIGTASSFTVLTPLIGYVGVRAEGDDGGVWANGYNGPGIIGTSSISHGIFGYSSVADQRGVFGHHTATTGGGYGVFGETASASGGYGVYGRVTTAIGYGWGVQGEAYSVNSVGGKFVNNGGGIGLYATGGGDGKERASLRVHNSNGGGGMSGFFTNQSGFHNTHFQNTGSGGVLFLQNAGDLNGNGGNDFITAVNIDGGDIQFRVLSSGEVRSDVGFSSSGADMAEMLPAAEPLQAGDVLVIDPEGKMARSSAPFQVNVAGVYSSQPGFIGGMPVNGNTAESIPLAVVGIIPVKASAESGPILPGDLLVSSSIPGHAMKAGPNPPPGTVIGKALSKLEKGTDSIRMLVSMQ